MSRFRLACRGDVGDARCASTRLSCNHRVALRQVRVPDRLHGILDAILPSAAKYYTSQEEELCR